MKISHQYKWELDTISCKLGTQPIICKLHKTVNLHNIKIKDRIKIQLFYNGPWIDVIVDDINENNYLFLSYI